MKTKHANTATMSEAEVYITLKKFPQIDEETAKSMARTITLKSEVATKTDIAELSADTRVEIEKTRTEMAQMEGKLTAQMAQMESKITSQMAQMESKTAQMESRLLRWFVSITIFGWGMMIAAMSLIR